VWLLKESRRKIREGTFEAWKKMMIKRVSTRL
jgi:hypothetical protein